MLIVTTENIPGKSYSILGFVEGATVQSKHVGKDIGAGFKTLVGGEIKSYSEMLSDSRNIATQRMVAQAESLGADAIVCARYATSAIMAGAAEMLIYGTAVKFQ